MSIASNACLIVQAQMRLSGCAGTSGKLRECIMSSVARVTEIIASSKKGFDDAIENGVKRATKTLKNVAGVWVASQEMVINKGKISEYRVRLKVTFVLSD
jgi:dodecin